MKLNSTKLTLNMDFIHTTKPDKERPAIISRVARKLAFYPALNLPATWVLFLLRNSMNHLISSSVHSISTLTSLRAGVLLKIYIMAGNKIKGREA